MQHVIITGGSSGIGKAIGLQLVQQGANLSIVARDRSKLATAQAELQAACASAEQQIFTLSADVADRVQAEGAMAAAIAHQGTPDWLITCAGIARPGYFRDLPLEVFEQTMAVNYFGSLYCIKAVLPAMLQRQQGQIVLVSSGAGLIGIYGYSPYCPSKFALRGLAESLRGELKPEGIGVSIAYPPDTDTPQWAEENKTKPPETQQITATAGVWSAADVARAIVRGAQTQRFAITPGTEMGVLNRFHSLLAPGLQWYFDRIVQKVRSTTAVSHAPMPRDQP
jgi:3-dehydrosphinganine reductase